MPTERYGFCGTIELSRFSSSTLSINWVVKTELWLYDCCRLILVANSY